MTGIERSARHSRYFSDENAVRNFLKIRMSAAEIADVVVTSRGWEFPELKNPYDTVVVTDSADLKHEASAKVWTNNSIIEYNNKRLLSFTGHL